MTVGNFATHAAGGVGLVLTAGAWLFIHLDGFNLMLMHPVILGAWYSAFYGGMVLAAPALVTLLLRLFSSRR